MRGPDSADPLVIDAAALLAQYQTPRGDVLLILNEDCPYEEQLHLVLVRSSMIIDQIVIGSMCESGIYRELGTDAERLNFNFGNEAVWTMMVCPDGKYTLGGLPFGARRRGGMLNGHYLFLSRKDGA